MIRILSCNGLELKIVLKHEFTIAFDAEPPANPNTTSYIRDEFGVILSHPDCNLGEFNEQKNNGLRVIGGVWEGEDRD